MLKVNHRLEQSIVLKFNEFNVVLSIFTEKIATFTPNRKFIYIAQPEQNTVTILNCVDYTVNIVITVGASPGIIGI